MYFEDNLETDTSDLLDELKLFKTGPKIDQNCQFKNGYSFKDYEHSEI